MTRGRLTSSIAAFSFLTVLTSYEFSADAKPQYIFLDVDGFGDTHVSGINSSGEVIGYTDDVGFLRDLDGTISIFTIPGYGRPYPAAVNESGYIAGITSKDIGGFDYSAGFIRAPDGTTTTFSATGDEKDETQATGMNASGTIVGSYDGGGFVRDIDGSVSLINFAGADWTAPTSINRRGVIAGIYDVKGNEYGFVRSPRGKWTTFTIPGAAFYNVRGLNDDGWLTGYWANSTGLEGSSFVRAPDGTITNFDINGIPVASLCINNLGTTTGPVKGERGFLRSLAGDISIFKLPLEKEPLLTSCVSDSGMVTGTYLVRSGVSRRYYGFVRTP